MILATFSIQIIYIYTYVTIALRIEKIKRMIRKYTGEKIYGKKHKIQRCTGISIAYTINGVIVGCRGVQHNYHFITIISDFHNSQNENKI